MRYLTREWYDLCQCTFLHFGLKACKEADSFCEELYKKLYNREERKFVKQEREVYDVDPESFLPYDGMEMVALDEFLSDSAQSNVVELKLSDEERARNQEIIQKFKKRPPFDEQAAKQLFSQIKDINGEIAHETFSRIPASIVNSIADKRVFLLGYATKQIIAKLKSLSSLNQSSIEQTLDECRRAAQEQKIDKHLAESFCFHDCLVSGLCVDKDITLSFDTSGGFSSYDKVTFKNAQIIQQDEGILGSVWLYEELYSLSDGSFEAHMMFSGGKYLTLKCKDIII